MGRVELLALSQNRDSASRVSLCYALLGQSTAEDTHTMGKGDKRTLRGKIFKGSYGKTRRHHPQKKAAAKPAGTKH